MALDVIAGIESPLAMRADVDLIDAPERPQLVHPVANLGGVILNTAKLADIDCGHWKAQSVKIGNPHVPRRMVAQDSMDEQERAYHLDAQGCPIYGGAGPRLRFPRIDVDPEGVHGGHERRAGRARRGVPRRERIGREIDPTALNREG